MNDIKKVLIVAICVVLVIAIAAGVSIGVMANTMNGLKDRVEELDQAYASDVAAMKAEIEAAKAANENLVTAADFEAKLAAAIGEQNQTMQSLITTAVKNQIDELGVEGLTEAQVQTIIDAAVANCLTEDDIDAIIANADTGLTKAEVKKLITDSTAGYLTYAQIANMIDDADYDLRAYLEKKLTNDMIKLVNGLESELRVDLGNLETSLKDQIGEIEGDLNDFKDTTLNTIRVTTSEEFAAALKAIKADTTILVAGGITTNVTIPGGYDVTIIGATTNATLKGQLAVTSEKAGTLTIKDLTVVVDDEIGANSPENNLSQTNKSAIVLYGEQTVICENVTFNMNKKDSTAITSWYDTGKGTNIIVTGCTFNCNGQRPIRANGNVTVEGSAFNDPYRYAVQLTSRLDKAIVNFNNNIINNGENGEAFVYGVQLEGETYGCKNIVVNGKGNVINAGPWDTKKESTMYCCECFRVSHDSITWKVETVAVHHPYYRPVETPGELQKALCSDDVENIAVVLENDIELPIESLGTINPGSEYKLGGSDTKNITIDLNGKTLTITTDYRSILGATNDDAVITIKNGSMTSSQKSGIWKDYDLGFANCNYMIENVTFEKAIAFVNAGKSAQLTNVTINEGHDNYAMWITAEGQEVTIDGLIINSAGRGIKIDDQYVGNAAMVTLNVSNATFTTAKKAAIMVKSAAGADITLNNVAISKVTADTTNAVWVDADAADYSGLVTVTGGTKVQEQ